METNTPEKISEQPQENIKLTKKGKPDRRSLTSKSNIQKAQSSVKEIIQKAKQKKAPPPLESEDDNDDSDDGGFMNLNIAVKIPEPVQSWRNKNTEPIKT